VQSVSHTWEDAETNRQVTFDVTYSVHGDRVTLHRLSPTRVMFFDQTGEAMRTIGIHTLGGHQLLAEQFKACGRRVAELCDAILQQQTMAVA
jgi:hypothetical protein